MRLQEMYYTIRNAVDNWVEPDISGVQSSVQNSVFACKNPQEIMDVLEPLRVIPAISERIDQVYACSPQFMIKDSPYLSSQGKNDLLLLMKKIRGDLSAMLDMCDALGIEENTIGFDVKLPPNITLDEMSECTRNLSKLFSQCPILRHDDCEIKLKGVDIGSSWLVFTIVGVGVAAGATYILNNLAALVDKVIILRSHWLTCKEQEERYRSLQMANDALEAVIKLNEEAIKKEQEIIAQEIAAEHNITEQEELNRLKLSMDILNNLTKNGTEIYAAVGSAKEIQAVFPAIERQALPESLPKYLTGTVSDIEE